MLMASVAGVFLVVGRLVADRALHVVILVEHEIFLVVEGRGFPLVGAVAQAAPVRNLAVQRVGGHLGLVAGNALLPLGGRQHVVLELCGFPLVGAVALHALVRDLTMESVRRPLMAGYALLPRRGVDQPVGEPLANSVHGHARVVAVARNAVLTHQLLVEGNLGLPVDHRGPLRGQHADVGHLVAGNAFLRRCAKNCVVAGKTIRLRCPMAIDQPSRTDHQMRERERQHRDGRQV